MLAIWASILTIFSDMFNIISFLNFIICCLLLLPNFLLNCPVHGQCSAINRLAIYCGQSLFCVLPASHHHESKASLCPFHLWKSRMLDLSEPQKKRSKLIRTLDTPWQVSHD